MGEDLTWTWGIGLITFAFGLGIGFLGAYLLKGSSGKVHHLEKELERMQEEFTAYRGNVNQHFEKTSELFLDMTDRYKSVYQHLAEGAQNLCADTLKTPLLDLPDTRLLKETADQTADDAALDGNNGSEPQGDIPPASGTPASAEQSKENQIH